MIIETRDLSKPGHKELKGTISQFENREVKRMWRPRDKEIKRGIAVLQALAKMGYRWEDLPDDELLRVFSDLSTFVSDTRWLYIWVARETTRRYREKRRLDKGNGLDGKSLKRSSA